MYFSMVIETTPKGRADIVLGKEYSAMHTDISVISGMLAPDDLVRFTRTSEPPAPEAAKVVVDMGHRVALKSQDGKYWMLNGDKLTRLKTGGVSDKSVQVRGLVVEN